MNKLAAIVIIALGPMCLFTIDPLTWVFILVVGIVGGVFLARQESSRKSEEEQTSPPASTPEPSAAPKKSRTLPPRDRFGRWTS